MLRETQDLIDSQYRSRPIAKRQGLVATSEHCF